MGTSLNRWLLISFMLSWRSRTSVAKTIEFIHAQIEALTNNHMLAKLITSLSNSSRFQIFLRGLQTQIIFSLRSRFYNERFCCSTIYDFVPKYFDTPKREHAVRKSSWW
jgi:hypothetical protein